MYTKPAIGMLLAFAGAITLCYGALQLLLGQMVIDAVVILIGVLSLVGVIIGAYFLIQAERAH